MSEKSELATMEPMFRAIIEGGGVFTLKPRGSSMRPTIVPGRDSVSIVALDGRAEKYDILFYKRPDGQFVLHRVAAVEEDGYTLCGDHQVDLEKGVREDWIIGVVSEIKTPKGTLARGSRSFLAAAKKRAFNRPLRVLWRGIRKLLGK
ncbi:MAG: S24/S26 family peptidase [Clostridia bacterium]|nr:S24/S26 family peptidase [Clostridia bacterium]